VGGLDLIGYPGGIILFVFLRFVKIMVERGRRGATVDALAAVEGRKGR
jgi:hypothetical protein